VNDSKALAYHGQVLVDTVKHWDNQAMLYRKEIAMPETDNEWLALKIRQAIADSGMTKKDIAAALGVSKQSITGWEKTGRITKPNLAKFSELLKINLKWFYSDEGTPADSIRKYDKLSVVPRKQERFDQNVIPVPAGKRAIPVISAVQAGKLTEINDPYPAGAGYAVEYADDDLSRWAFALEIDGDSMLPDFRPGDRVIVDPEIAPNPGDFVVAKNGREEATFKKYRPRGIGPDGNMIFELVPLNDDYPTMRSDVESLRVIGVMVEHRKKYRRTSKI
jgi:SOS-response transcriptional repressor LexA